MYGSRVRSPLIALLSLGGLGCWLAGCLGEVPDLPADASQVETLPITEISVSVSPLTPTGTGTADGGAMDLSKFGAPAQQCQASAADEPAAAAMAKACGSRVEVESERSEYSEVYVEPSGNRTIVTAIVPQRARRLDGTWGQIDTTLQQVGDLLAPTATVADVRFSTGGTGPFVTLTREGHSFTLSWPAPLPQPTVSGDSATYAEVLPDVDLVARATATGFTHLLVVKTARGAMNPAVRRASYHIGGDTILRSTPEGGLIAEADGVRVASAEPPIMWDTPKHHGTRDPGISDAEDEPTRVRRVGSEVSAGHLVLTPDPSVLADPDAGFPLMIDPLYTTPPIGQWAYASIDNQNGPTTDTNIAPGDPSPAATELRVGNDPDSTHLYRSFMRFSISGVAGKKILAAKIWGKVDHTWKCASRRPTYFYRSAAISTTPRQSWPGPALQLLLGNNNVYANESSCGESNMTFEVSTTTLVNDLQTFANASASYYFVAISAGENTSGLNEAYTERWMRYFLSDFKLYITYNTKPNKPDSLTVDNKPCISGASRPFLQTATPTLRAHVTDPDNDTMDVWFAWAKWNGTSFVDEPGAGKQDSVPSGDTALYNVTGNVDGGIYTFRAQSNDSPSHSSYLTSDVTHMPGNCEWQVDLTPPTVPTIISDVYQEGSTACPGGCGSVGQTGRFTFSSSPDTQAFLWGWSDPPTNVLTPSTLGASVFVDWTPTSDGSRTLYVRAIDRAGNESNIRSYQFYVAAESIARARWLLNEPTGVTQLIDDTGNGNTATISDGTLGAPGRVVPGNDGISRSAMQFDGINDVAATVGPVLPDTSKSFSVAAWVKLADNTITHRVLDQVGTSNSAFRLEYDKGANAWKLTAPVADGSAYPGATSTSTPRLNTWTHLTGTYDSAAKELKLYVNGALERTTTGITTWNANGVMRIGYGWAGSLSKVQVWDRVIFEDEVFALSDPTRAEVGVVGVWRMENVDEGLTSDESGLYHDLRLYNGAVLGVGKTGASLRMDGVDDYAVSDAQVLYTDQSFTISVWARPTTTAASQTFVSQQSDGSHAGFSFGFDSQNGGVWRFRMYASSTDTTNTTSAVTPAVNVTTAYHHLVGVFDAQKLELRLYVDGLIKATTPMNALWQPWNAPGPLLIGRHHNGAVGSEFTSGDLDEVRVYQGAVADVTQIP